MRTGLLLSVLVCASCAGAPDYIAIVRDFEDSKNRGDIDASLKYFTDETTLHFGPLGSVSGLEQIRGIHGYDLALNTALHFKSCVVAAKEVRCRVTESNDWLSTTGIESIDYDESLFVFDDDGQIASITSTLSAKSINDMGAAMALFDEWARTNQPEQYAELFGTDGRFVYSFENGQRVLSLLREWRESARL